MQMSKKHKESSEMLADGEDMYSKMYALLRELRHLEEDESYYHFVVNVREDDSDENCDDLRKTQREISRVRKKIYKVAKKIVKRGKV